MLSLLSPIQHQIPFTAMWQKIFELSYLLKKKIRVLTINIYLVFSIRFVKSFLSEVVFSFLHTCIQTHVTDQYSGTKSCFMIMSYLRITQWLTDAFLFVCLKPNCICIGVQRRVILGIFARHNQQMCAPATGNHSHILVPKLSG